MLEVNKNKIVNSDNKDIKMLIIYLDFDKIARSFNLIFKELIN